MVIIESGLEGWNPTYNACSSTREGRVYLSASATGFHQEETNNADMHLHQVVLRS